MEQNQENGFLPIKPVGDILPVVQQGMKGLYDARLKRLKVLMSNHSMKDYLGFVSDMVQAQLELLRDYPLPALKVKEDVPLVVDWQQFPLSKLEHHRSVYWLEVLDKLLGHFDQLPHYKDGAVRDTITRIREFSEDTKQAKADALLAGDFSVVGSDVAPFMWAALSLYWSQLARQKPLDLRPSVGVERHYCPVCGSAPVASVIVNQSIDGLRYLHCNLCESEWHYVRTLCSNCEAGGKLNYWSLDDVDAQIKAESCDDCHSYLKVMSPKKGSDFTPEPVVDDLASLALDVLMEEKGYARSTFNPFLFPSE